jgi:hypothetical protein
MQLAHNPYSLAALDERGGAAGVKAINRRRRLKFEGTLTDPLGQQPKRGLHPP